jgi:OPT family oligopeptide transporter
LSFLSRKQVIIKERLRFPSGFSTAVLISVLHGKGRQSNQQELDEAAKGGFASLVPREETQPTGPVLIDAEDQERQESEESEASKVDWAYNMRLLLICFLTSGLFTVTTFFFPILRNLPIFGTAAAQTWLWTLNPSFAYIGQGIIMGPETTMHMLLGAVVGWALLSPLAKTKGWAPGPVADWENGSKGWIVWVSLSIMLVDAIVSLAYIALHPLIGPQLTKLASKAQAKVLSTKLGRHVLGSSDYTLVPGNDQESEPLRRASGDSEREDAECKEDEDTDAPKHQRVGKKTVTIGLTLSILLCVGTIHIVFGDLVPLYATVIAVFMALVLSIMGVRALGETDLNPVSGISKLAQLFFAFIIPQSNKNSVLINLVAGAVVSPNFLHLIR